MKKQNTLPTTGISSITACFKYITLFLATVALITGCGQKSIYTPKHKVSPPSSTKQIPSRSKIPPTQKPYRIMGHKYYPIPSAYGFSQKGIASWYGKKFHGRKTSNGETYDMYAATAAHKTLPMNTRLLVENLENGKETIVRINDRGPFVRGRIIDLSNTAAREIDMTKKGTARVKITALGEAATSVRGGRKIEQFLPYQDFNAGEFFVQIGSFANKNNADRLKNEMLAQGRKAQIMVYDKNNKRFYRVQIVAGNNLHKAERLERTMETRFPGAFVIAK